MTTPRILPYFVGLAALLLLLGAAIVCYAGGLFYTLDDPYIHLAMAENIARGHYGINLSEPSNPCSSILYPLLLAAFVPLGLDEYGPLIVNVLAVMASFYLLHRILARYCFAGTPLQRVAPGIGLLILVVLNGVGVAFTGMEHSLQILVALGLLLGLLELMVRDRVTRYLVPCAIVLPLIRFEGLSVATATVLLLVQKRRLGHAGVIVGGLIATLTLYAAAMAALGLPALPTSVLVKLSAAQSWVLERPLLSFGFATVANMVEALGSKSIVLLAILFALSGLSYRANGAGSVERALSAFAMLIVLAHILFGKFDFYARYELYVLFITVPIVIFLYREALIRGWAVHPKRRLAAAALALTVLGLHLGPYALATTPLAARNIASQQYQMHRFVTDCWRQPVAINDLGWVAYRNDADVLDLWGLGSERAWRARAAGKPGWMAELVAERNVGLAMIYEDWFGGQIPSSWRKLATLRLAPPRITASRDAVAFFATRARAVPRIRACVDRLRDRLPPGAIIDDAPPAAADANDRVQPDR